MNDFEIAERIASIERRVRELDSERALLDAQLAELQRQYSRGVTTSTSERAPLTARSTSAEKIAFFRRLFAGRLDVFPVRWENAKSGRSGYSPACANEWIPQVCRKPQIKCSACPNQAFIPVSDEVIGKHLRGDDVSRKRHGDFVIGVYPLFENETCRFLAADFDGADWSTDALAFLETCRSRNIPAALERSRSGEGGHVWIFFTENVGARDARQLGAALLTETMERRPEISFKSYDRFFPNQDTMPAGGFGNLIALPLQRRARERGNTLFVDEALEPHSDQWAFLSSLQRLEPSAVTAFVREAEARDSITGVRMPVEDDAADQPWLLSPSRRPSPLVLNAPLPASVKVTLADDLYIDRSELPAPIVTRLVRVAAFQNPEFYRAQAMRMPTYEKPRIISCAELHRQHVALPRGCLDEVLALFSSLGVATKVVDLRERGQPLTVAFEGTLRKQQLAAVRALEPHQTGVLAATTAFGKTIVAAALVAKRARSTLILVHRRELLEQWVERLCAFLSLDRKEIGTIAGGRRNPPGASMLPSSKAWFTAAKSPTPFRDTGISSSTSAITFQQKVSNWSPGAPKRSTSWACPRPLRERTGITQSSSCSAVRFGIGWIRKRKPRSAASSILCMFARCRRLFGHRATAPHVPLSDRSTPTSPAMRFGINVSSMMWLML